MVGGANLRTSPGVADNLLRTLPHNGPLRVLDGVQGDDGDEWYTVNSLDSKTYEPDGRSATSTTRWFACRACPIRRRRPIADGRCPDRHFEADLHEPGHADRVRGRRPDLVDADAQRHDLQPNARAGAHQASCGGSPTRR